MLIPEYMSDMIINCEIIHDECDNLSDHLPVYIKMAIPIKGEHGTADDCNRKRYPRFPRPRWKDPLFIKLYKKNIEKTMDEIPTISLESVTASSAKDHIFIWGSQREKVW